MDMLSFFTSMKTMASAVSTVKTVASAVSTVKTVASAVSTVMSTVTNKLMENPHFKETVDTIIYTGSELIMSVTCLGGPLMLGAYAFCSAATVAFSSFAAKKYHLSEKLSTELAWDVVSAWWKFSMKLWHGQEFRGYENIPRDGGALVIWFHGPMPADYFGLIAEVWYRQRRVLKTVMDRILSLAPGSWMFTKHMGCTAADKDECVASLSRGELMAIAPGGSRESLFADGYQTLWNGRTGFAEVALKANVPIVPVFTQNIQQAYMTMKSGMVLWRAVYERTRYPIIPIWGGFPVKLVTHIGEPIYPLPGESPEQLKERVKHALEDLIRQHQTPNITLWGAIKERWSDSPKTSTTVTIDNNKNHAASKNRNQPAGPINNKKYINHNSYKNGGPKFDV